jgi:hypothetical protein
VPAQASLRGRPPDASIQNDSGLLPRIFGKYGNAGEAKDSLPICLFGTLMPLLINLVPDQSWFWGRLKASTS